MGEEHRGDAAVLASGKLEIQALNRVTNLREVIEQIERGDVQRIREKYGPQRGRPGHPIWPSIKSTVNRRERVYHQLMDACEFGGDKERFFAFFRSRQDNEATPLTNTRKRKADESPNTLPFRLIAEAIPHRDKDIGMEKSQVQYRDEVGSFSDERWRQLWGEANDWEVWRALGKEHYPRR